MGASLISCHCTFIYRSSLQVDPWTGVGRSGHWPAYVHWSFSHIPDLHSSLRSLLHYLQRKAYTHMIQFDLNIRKMEIKAFLVDWIQEWNTLRLGLTPIWLTVHNEQSEVVDIQVWWVNLRRAILPAEWSEILPLTACCFSPKPESESCLWYMYMIRLPVTWG